MASADQLVNLPRRVCLALGLDPKRTRRAVEFSIVGATGAVVDLAVTIELLGHTHYLVANTAGFLLAVTWNFVWNWIVVFDRPDGELGWQYLSYVVLHALTFVGRAIVVAVLVEGAGTPATVATIIGVGAAAVLNFLGTERIFDGVGEYWFDVVAGINQLAHAVYGSSVRHSLRTAGIYSLLYGGYMRVLAMIYREDVLMIEAGDARAMVYTERPPEIVSVLHTLEKERPVIEAFVDAIDPGDTVWDVGANLGVYAVLAAEVAEQVVAFEPFQPTAARLAMNVALSDAAVEVNDVALGASVGLVELDVDREEIGTQTPTTGQGGRQATTRVDQYPGDMLVEQGGVPAPTVVKIDVEGAEAAVLDGLAHTLAEHVEYVLVETHECADGIRERLEAAGFEVEAIVHAGQSYLVGRRDQ